jgi:Rps23 Pro-64 3,4-dihydroxylase Tpa1-like proline 4-hydroxylase
LIAGAARMSALPPLTGRFLPHRRIRGWLGEAQSDALLAYAIAAEARFEPTRIGNDEKSRIDHSTRRSLLLKDLGPFAPLLEKRALGVQAELEAAFGMPHVPTEETQIELVAHGDGDFYGAHLDTFTGDQYMPGERRRLSLVYYVHRRPRPFTGGRLKLFDLTGATTIDVEPEHDSLLAFPSFARHEVEPVSCPAGGFANSRFSLNIWLAG